MRMPAGRFLAACVGAAMAAGLCGCAIIGQQCVLERQFTESQVEDIRKGETTKKEVLDRLGPPAAVARPGAGAADNVLRRFAATGKVGGPLIYRYDASALTWGNLCVYGEYGGGCIPSTPLLKEQKLWLLIDEESGRVVDRILEETVREEGGAHVEPWPGP